MTAVLPMAYSSRDVPKPIPDDDSAGASSTVAVVASGSIEAST